MSPSAAGLADPHPLIPEAGVVERSILGTDHHVRRCGQRAALLAWGRWCLLSRHTAGPGGARSRGQPATRCPSPALAAGGHLTPCKREPRLLMDPSPSAAGRNTLSLLVFTFPGNISPEEPEDKYFVNVETWGKQRPGAEPPAPGAGPAELQGPPQLAGHLSPPATAELEPSGGHLLA